MIHKASLVNARRVLAAIGLALAATGAQAAAISLVPVSGPVATGGQETFNLVADFGTQTTIGGGIDFTWNPSVLTFQGFTFGSDVAPPKRDTSFDRIDPQTSSLLSIVFGNLSPFSLPSDTVIGTLTFNAVGPAGNSTLISLKDSVKWGSFLADDGLTQIPVTYTGATATIIPVPAAVWLMLSGLLGLGGIGVSKRPRTAE